MANLKRYASRRTDDEWYRIIMDCRKSGLSDTRWCQLNDIFNLQNSLIWIKTVFV